MAAGARRINHPPLDSEIPVAEDICEWAERNVRVVTGGRPGLVKLDPYQKEILRAAIDPAVRAVALMMPSQVGKSFKISIIVTWHIDQSPGDILFIHPSQAVRDRFGREKLSPVVLGVPGIKAKIRTNNRGTLPANGFAFRGGAMTVSTAGSVGGTTGATSRLVIADEVDLYQGGGSTLSSLEQRTASIPNAKMIVASTPTIKSESVIEAEYARTDQREWQVPCPICGAIQPLDLWDAVTPDGIQCRHCPAIWDEDTRRQAIMFGHWQITNEAHEPGRVGFHMTQLASLNTALERTRLSAAGYGARDIATQIMAEPYEDVEIEAPKPEQVKKAIRPFLPRYYSVGVDVQRRSLECVLISLSEYMTHIHMESSFTIRRTEGVGCWIELRDKVRALSRQLPGRGIPVPVTVDGGGGWYEWVHEGLRHAYGHRAMQEGDGGEPPYVTVVIGDSAPSLGKPLWGARRGRGEKGYRHVILAVDQGKADIYSAIREGNLSVAQDINDAIIDEIVSERLVAKEGRVHRSGRPGLVKYTWVPRWPGIPNHALDALNYAWCRANNEPIREV